MPGFYKAFAGNVKCSKCPPHSLTYVEATSVCQCEKGYFRAEKDPPTMACTRKSDQYQCLQFSSPVPHLFIIIFFKKLYEIVHFVHNPVQDNNKRSLK